MKRVAPPSLCITLLATILSTAAAQQDREQPGTAIIALVPEIMRPLCAPPWWEDEPWATRFPKEYRDWENSVHGRAFLSGNTDAPGCTGCHGEPERSVIRTPTFRLDTPARCARCHANRELMSKYEIAADTYDSYRADYHGATIEYYRRHDPSAWRYEAVCSDCHQSHAVYPADDKRSSVAPANLLATCRRCHPKAEGSFTSITTGHFRTDPGISPLAYYIKVIYQILIPTLIGLMLAYVALDLLFRLRRKLAGAKR